MKVDREAKLWTLFVLIALTSVAKSQTIRANEQRTDAFLMEGFTCEMKDTGEPGRCTRASSCLKAEEQLFQGGNYTVCSYVKDEPVLCCRKHSVLDDIIQESLPGDSTKRKSKCAYYHEQIQRMDREDERSDDKYALKAEFPHVVAVGYHGENDSTAWGCTGTLLSERFVLAAASCAKHYQYGYANTVRLGTTNLKEHDALSMERMVKRIYLRHEDEPLHFCDDIALIELSQPVVFTPRVYPACLPINTWIPNDLTVVGWGLCEERGENDFKLRKERIRIHDVSQIECQGIGPQKLHLNNENCTDTIDAGLYIENYIKFFTVHGLSSYAQICVTDDETYKIKYTNVGQHVKWIEDIVWK